MKSYKKIFMLLLISLALISFFLIVQPIQGAGSSPPNSYWYKTFGGSGDDQASSVIQTNDKGYAVVGSESSFGLGQKDALLIKTDSSGNMQWNKSYGDTGNDLASAIIQTADGGYAIAGFTNSFGIATDHGWLIKTDPNGNMLWNKTYGGAGYDLFFAMVQADNGGYAMAGSTTSSGAGATDVWLVRVDQAGNMLWNHTYGGTGNDAAYALAKTTDGGFAIVGSTTSFGAGGVDSLLIKTDSNGAQQWIKTYGASGDDESFSVTQTADGGYAMGGLTNSLGSGNNDFWLVKTDSQGTSLWNQTYGGSQNDESAALVQTSDGGYALAGTTTSYGSGGKDAWLVKTVSSGIEHWNQTYGGGGNEAAASLIQDTDGNYVLAGTTTSFGSGSSDYYLVKAEYTRSTPTSLFSNTAIIVLVVVVAIVIAVVLAILALKKKKH